MMTVAIFGRTIDAKQTPFVESMLSELSRLNVVVIIEEEFKNSLHACSIQVSEYNTFKNHDDLVGSVDFVISMGGDGTMLNTVELVRDSGIPIMGINTGRLGFLSDISKEEIAGSLALFVQGKYKMDPRTLLQLESEDGLFNDWPYALNEVTIHKSDSAAMISINTMLDDNFLNSYWADGLIVATPTGSTAYSLSCGGPIIVPSAENLIINPIAPHNLNVRPVVVSDKSVLTLSIESRNDNFLISLDSRSLTVSNPGKLKIRTAPFKVNLIMLEGQNFFTTLRNKLMWGLDKRN